MGDLYGEVTISVLVPHEDAGNDTLHNLIHSTVTRLETDHSCLVEVHVNENPVEIIE